MGKIETTDQMKARWAREQVADLAAVSLGLARQTKQHGIMYWTGNGEQFRAGYWAGREEHAAVAVPGMQLALQWCAGALQEIADGRDTVRIAELGETMTISAILDMADMALATPEPPATEDSSAGDQATMTHGEAAAALAINSALHRIRAGNPADAIEPLQHALHALAQAEAQAEPVMFINPKVIDKRTGKIATGTGALTHADSKHGGWTFPVYAAPQAQPAHALHAIQNPQEMADWLIAMRSRLGSCREASQAWSEEIGLKSWDNYTALSAAFAAMAAAQEGGAE